MKNWIIKLIVAMVVTVAANLLVTAIVKAFHIEIWNSILAIISFAIIFIITLVKIAPSIERLTYLLAGIFLTISFLGNKWAYYSANETVHLKNIEELLTMPQKPIYFTLNKYSYDTRFTGHASMGSNSSSLRKGYHSNKMIEFVVTPLYTDSAKEEVKAWIATNTFLREDRLTPDSNRIIAFELLTQDLGYYKDATRCSPHRHRGSNPIFIAPVYDQYITRSTWGMYFLISLAIGTAVMVLIGAVLNWKQKRKAEKGEKIA